MSPSCCVRGADVLQWSPVKTKPRRGHFSLSQRRIVGNEINDWPVHPVSLCHNQQTTINNELTWCQQQGPIAPCETFPRFGTPHLVCRCYSLEWLLYQRTSLVDVLLSWMDQKSFFGCVKSCHTSFHPNDWYVWLSPHCLRRPTCDNVSKVTTTVAATMPTEETILASSTGGAPLRRQESVGVVAGLCWTTGDGCCSV